MAKAKDIAGLDAGVSYRRAAALTVDVRAQELFEQAEGVLDTSDIERVHDMRVATRRLRAVLEIYEPCFPRKQWRSALGDVKALADALGERRDPDVQLAQLDEFAAAVKAADRPGVELFAERVRALQSAGNDSLRVALARVEERDLRGRLAALAAAAAPSEPASPPSNREGPGRDAVAPSDAGDGAASSPRAADGVSAADAAPPSATGAGARTEAPPSATGAGAPTEAPGGASP